MAKELSSETRSTKQVKKNTVKGANNLVPGNKNSEQLTDKQAAFCREYMLDKNATKAAIRAGYNERNAHGTGFKLLSHPAVKKELERLVNEDIADYKITHQMITNELAKIAFSDMNDFVTLVETGKGDSKVQTIEFKPTAATSKGNGKIIKTLKIGRRGIELELHSKGQALEMLAKHVGYFGVDNSQKSNGGVFIYVPDNGRGDVVAPPPEEKK